MSHAAVAAEPRENSVGIRFVRIPAGAFEMGSSDADAAAERDEKPVHRVIIARAFWLSACEVTQQQFERVMGENPSWFSLSGGGRAEAGAFDPSRLPTDMVSWHDAVDFCRRLGELPQERAHGRRYRLPTEAEWEYACRAGTKTRFSCGDELQPADANVRIGNSPPRSTLPVGSYPPNAWGLYDMHGNVWEWCADEYHFGAYQRVIDGLPLPVDGGVGHVVRGGDWRSAPGMARSANRDFTRSTRRDLGNGFRVLMEWSDD